MSKVFEDGIGFAINLGSSLLIVWCVVATLVEAEVYLSSGHILADIEIANACSPCGDSMALVTPKSGRVPN